MGYQIHYGQSVVKKELYEANKKRSGWRRFAGICCAVAISVAILSHERVQAFLIPGDDAITKQAFAVFTEELRNGEPIVDAVESFCREIISFEIQ